MPVNNSLPNVYDYHDFVDYLQDSYDQLKASRPKYSLRSWSLRLGFKNPSALSRILTKNRRPTLSQVRTIASSLNLSSEETLYLETITQCDPSSIKTMAPQLRSLFEKNKTIDKLKLSVEQFKLMSEWYYPTMIEALGLNTSLKNAEDFQKILGSDLELETIEKALMDLEDLGLLAKEARGYVRKQSNTNYIDPQESSAAVRNFHTQMLQQAKEKLHSIPREQRDIRGFTMALNFVDYPKAQEILDRAYAEIMTLAQDEKAEQVYHFTTAFFPLTKNSPS